MQYQNGNMKAEYELAYYTFLICIVSWNIVLKIGIHNTIFSLIDQQNQFSEHFLNSDSSSVKSKKNSYIARCKKHRILSLAEKRKIGDLPDEKLSLPQVFMKLKVFSSKQGSVPSNFYNYKGNSYFIRSLYTFNPIADAPDFDQFDCFPNRFKSRLTVKWFDIFLNYLKLNQQQQQHRYVVQQLIKLYIFMVNYN